MAQIQYMIYATCENEIHTFYSDVGLHHIAWWLMVVKPLVNDESTDLFLCHVFLALF